jgi:hypothetical protein
MTIVINIVSFMILIMFVGKNVHQMRWKHFIFISFVVFAQLIVTLILVFTKERPPGL